MKKISTTLIFFLFSTFSIVAQNGIIKGKVFNPISNEAIPFANVVIQGTTTGTSTDIDGNYIISGLEPKLYNLEATSLGFEKAVVFEVQTFNNRPVFIDIEMMENSQM